MEERRACVRAPALASPLLPLQVFSDHLTLRTPH
ncbi:unnamed protein product [Tetraodon nigroviridis]|uniref:(spotted green pufferfish) hypothetical protein n=1 Tax=Tetraodon nigroviridis TaxID=99883 RepID=Q4S3X2_TETNG|nr:unnamed protein product [Tetraodon nigroviridis]